MELTETAWTGFRNLKPRRRNWAEGVNVLSGPNGAGKSNLLESFSVLCGWGAFPGNRTSLLPAWGGDERALLAARTGGEREFGIRAVVGSRISLRVNDERVTCSALRGMIPSLSFLPGDIDLLDGSPGVRRLFLDKICALLSPLYARRLSEYRRIARERTALLRRSRAESAEFRASSVPLAQLGGWIRARRFRTVTLLAETLTGGEAQGGGGAEYASRLLPFPVSLTLLLRDAPGKDSVCDSDPETTGADLMAALRKSAERERHARTVLVGPHRDDLLFSCFGRPVASSLSRGQKRRVVAAAILAAGRLIEARMRIRPILLLDDITAELDADGRRLMGDALAATGWQVFVAATENPFPESRATLIPVSEGAAS